MAVLTENEQKFELLIDGIINQNFGICDHFISTEFAEALKNQLLTKFVTNNLIIKTSYWNIFFQILAILPLRGTCQF